MGVEQGMFAYGSAGFVLGAELGNAIANEGRKQQYILSCMTMLGWQAVAPGTKSAVSAGAPKNKNGTWTGRPAKGNGYFPPAP